MPRSMRRPVRSCCTRAQVAKTFFFSSSGGRTASAEDVWGEPVPYLVSVADPYDSISPHHDWGPLVFTGTKLAKVLKMKGQRVVDLQPELNSSGRVKVLNVVGTKSTLAVPGADVRRRLGVRSTWFSIGVLSLAAPSQPVTFGGRGKLAGLARGLNQTVLQSLQGDTWTEMATLKADKDGVVTALVKPTVTTRYRLSMGKVNTAARPRHRRTARALLSGTNPGPAQRLRSTRVARRDDGPDPETAGRGLAHRRPGGRRGEW